MIKAKKNYLIRLAYLAIDIVCICFAIYLACLIRHTTLSFDITFQNLFLNVDNPFRPIFIFWTAITMLLLSFQPIYQTKRAMLEGFEIGAIAKYVSLSSFVSVVAIFGFRIQGFPRSVLLVGTIMIIAFLSIWRILKRAFVKYLVAKGYNNFNAIIIGAGKVGTALAEEIRKNPGLGIKVVGFLDDYKTGEIEKLNIKALGKISNLKSVVKREFVNKVFITIHHNSEVFLKILEQAKELGIAIRVVPQGFELMPRQISNYNIGIIPILEYSDNFQFKKQMGKRTFDFLTSLIGTILALPVLVIVSVAIKFTSKGSVFYTSKRYGRNGRIFNMYKFRSMNKDADKLLHEISEKNEVDGPIFKIKNDPRITKIGKFLRRYSLDELPQIINVLKGDMSLVGPRPLPIDQIVKEDLKQLKRLEVRPGITGLWQIRGRSDISFMRLVKWDMWYINNWSFWLDLSILFQTIPVVLKGRGAY
ncbi:MAG: sugar transferase [Candidatus Zapsychrus exili]|nr:sugar transferase [Candidatus Zapsychrus exili]